MRAWFRLIPHIVIAFIVAILIVAATDAIAQTFSRAGHVESGGGGGGGADTDSGALATFAAIDESPGATYIRFWFVVPAGTTLTITEAKLYQDTGTGPNAAQWDITIVINGGATLATFSGVANGLGLDTVDAMTINQATAAGGSRIDVVLTRVGAPADIVRPAVTLYGTIG